MKIVSNPPKTGEEFTVSWIDSDGVGSSIVARFNIEWDMFEIKDPNHNWISITDVFVGTTILVSKGE